jgi:hypothetical protein
MNSSRQSINNPTSSIVEPLHSPSSGDIDIIDSMPSPTVFHYQTSNPFIRERTVCSATNQTIMVRKVKAGILPADYTPSDIDVCCGRGKAYHSHNGNKAFIKIVQESAQQYIDAQKRVDKSMVVAAVVRGILDRGVRFVKQDKTTKRWYQMSEDQAHEKTGHAIRDYIKNMDGKKSSSASTTATNTTTSSSRRRDSNSSMSSAGSSDMSITSNTSRSSKSKQAIQKQQKKNYNDSNNWAMSTAGHTNDMAMMMATLHSSAPSSFPSYNNAFTNVDQKKQRKSSAVRRSTSWEPIRASLVLSGGEDATPRFSRSTSDLLANVLKVQNDASMVSSDTLMSNNNSNNDNVHYHDDGLGRFYDLSFDTVNNHNHSYNQEHQHQLQQHYAVETFPFHDDNDGHDDDGVILPDAAPSTTTSPDVDIFDQVADLMSKEEEHAHHAPQENRLTLDNLLDDNIDLFSL